MGETRQHAMACLFSENLKEADYMAFIQEFMCVPSHDSSLPREKALYLLLEDLKDSSLGEKIYLINHIIQRPTILPDEFGVPECTPTNQEEEWEWDSEDDVDSLESLKIEICRSSCTPASQDEKQSTPVEDNDDEWDVENFK